MEIQKVEASTMTGHCATLSQSAGAPDCDGARPLLHTGKETVMRSAGTNCDLSGTSRLLRMPHPLVWRLAIVVGVLAAFVREVLGIDLNAHPVLLALIGLGIGTVLSAYSYRRTV